MARARGVVARGVEHAFSFRPLVPGESEAGHARTLPLHGALTPPVGAPTFVDLVDDPLAQLVAGAREGKGGMRVQALQVLAATRARDPNGKLGAEPALLGIGAREALAALVVLLRGVRVPLHPAVRFDAGDPRHEPGAG